MYHFVYKTTLENSNKYYIGRHSSKDLEDGYFGSGKWINSIKDRSKLKKEILEFCNDFTILREREEYHINLHIDDIYCMNFTNTSCGFGSGEYNHNCSPENRKRNSDRLKGLGNPMYGRKHSEETLKKLSERMLGENNIAKRPEVREKISKNVSISRTGSKMSDSGRELIRQKRKIQHETGIRTMHMGGAGELNGMYGKNHTEESKQKMQGKRNFHWITNEVNNKLLSITLEIPVGWRKGRVHSEATKQKIRDNKKK